MEHSHTVHTLGNDMLLLIKAWRVALSCCKAAASVVFVQMTLHACLQYSDSATLDNPRTPCINDLASFRQQHVPLHPCDTSGLFHRQLVRVQT